MAHLPRIRYWYSREAMLVKFCNMKPPLFSRVLSAFKQQFPEAKWRKDIGAWELPKDTHDSLSQFIFNAFDKHSRISLETYYTPEQLPLPLKWATNNTKQCNRRRKHE